MTNGNAIRRRRRVQIDEFDEQYNNEGATRPIEYPPITHDTDFNDNEPQAAPPPSEGGGYGSGIPQADRLVPELPPVQYNHLTSYATETHVYTSIVPSQLPNTIEYDRFAQAVPGEIVEYEDNDNRGLDEGERMHNRMRKRAREYQSSEDNDRCFMCEHLYSRQESHRFPEYFIIKEFIDDNYGIMDDQLLFVYVQWYYQTEIRHQIPGYGPFWSLACIERHILEHDITQNVMDQFHCRVAWRTHRLLEKEIMKVDRLRPENRQVNMEAVKTYWSLYRQTLPLMTKIAARRTAKGI